MRYRLTSIHFLQHPRLRRWDVWLVPAWQKYRPSQIVCRPCRGKSVWGAITQQKWFCFKIKLVVMGWFVETERYQLLMMCYTDSCSCLLNFRQVELTLKAKANVLPLMTDSGSDQAMNFNLCIQLFGCLKIVLVLCLQPSRGVVIRASFSAEISVTSPRI